MSFQQVAYRLLPGVEALKNEDTPAITFSNSSETALRQPEMWKGAH
jgi:hypothetical protein